MIGGMYNETPFTYSITRICVFFRGDNGVDNLLEGVSMTKYWTIVAIVMLFLCIIVDCMLPPRHIDVPEEINIPGDRTFFTKNGKDIVMLSSYDEKGMRKLGYRHATEPEIICFWLDTVKRKSKPVIMFYGEEIQK